MFSNSPMVCIRVDWHALATMWVQYILQKNGDKGRDKSDVENKEKQNDRERERKMNKWQNGKMAFSCVKEDFPNFIGLLLYIVSPLFGKMPCKVTLARRAFLYVR